MNNIAKGVSGENLAAKYLEDKGYKILARNCIFAGAELDIVAILPVKTQKKQIKEDYKREEVKSKVALKCKLSGLSDILVFVEVKYSSTREFGEPYERVNLKKQRQITKAAEQYIYKYKLSLPTRFDVISIVGSEVNHIEEAF